MESNEIIDIVRDTVARVSDRFREEASLDVHFMHGSSVHIKETLDQLTQSSASIEEKYPLIALFTPIVEDRTSEDYYSQARLSVMIATGSLREWDNDQREEHSFRGILRPVYELFLEELMKDHRVIKTYKGKRLPHEYSENYSYGRYGATDANGEELSDPIDAINIKSLAISIKPYKNCNRI